MTHVATGDCERCRPGLVAQPVNTVSSLAFVAAGVPLVRGRRPVTRALGWAAVAAGLGSVAYHGPGTAAGRYAHDASLLALLGLMALDDGGRATGRTPPPVGLAAIPPLAAVGALPPLTEVAQPVAGALAVAAGVARAIRRGAEDGPAPLAGSVVLGAGVVLHALGRTGGPLCEPDSRLQPHAAWHVAAAAAVLLRHAR
ncbi:MAG TPA: hypothetical protein VGO60_12055 [Iamia sp.]|jgi:hypothetical protein|nr:hypothetical protein [Iamia sp.]